MAVRGYILVEAVVAKARAVGEELTKLDHPSARILAVDTVTGPYDVIVQLEADDLDKLGTFVTDAVQNVDGVQRTTTCLVVSLA